MQKSIRKKMKGKSKSRLNKSAKIRKQLRKKREAFNESKPFQAMVNALNSLLIKKEGNDATRHETESYSHAK